MAVRRVVVALLVAVVAATPGAAPAAAHGAPTYPVSRAAACAPDGEHVDTPACRAAVKAGAALREWDNIRVFGVNGRDRERVPDGELYLTRVGYAPTRKLTWADLDTVPFLRVTDPPVRGGAYRMSAQLPGDRPGRHVIYTVWQNSDTADTYYSCSDVDVRPAGPDGRTDEEPAGVAAAEATPAVAEEVLAGTEDAARAAGDVVAGAESNVPVASVTYLDGRRLPLIAAGALVALLLVWIGMRLRGSRSGPPPGRPCTVRNHRANPRVW